MWDSLVLRGAASGCAVSCESDCEPEPHSAAATANGYANANEAAAGAGAETDAESGAAVASASAAGELDDLLSAAAASTCAIPLPFGWERALDARHREYFIKYAFSFP